MLLVMLFNRRDRVFKLRGKMGRQVLLDRVEGDRQKQRQAYERGKEEWKIRRLWDLVGQQLIDRHLVSRASEDDLDCRNRGHTKKNRTFFGHYTIVVSKEEGHD